MLKRCHRYLNVKKYTLFSSIFFCICCFLFFALCFLLFWASSVSSFFLLGSVNHIAEGTIIITHCTQGDLYYIIYIFNNNNKN